MDNSITNFSLIKPLLYENFVSHNSVALSLIKHYYETSRDRQEEYLHDPGLQANWCIQNLPYFSKVAKYLRKIRNKVEHQDFLSEIVLERTLKHLEILLPKTIVMKSQVKFLIDVLKKILDMIGETGSSLDQMERCPLCNSSVLCLNRELLSEFEKFLRERNSPSLNPGSETLLSSGSEFSNNRYKLSDLKLTMREELKNARIRLCETGTNGIFRSWSGTVAWVDLEGIGRKRINIRTEVEVLDRPIVLLNPIT